MTTPTQVRDDVALTSCLLLLLGHHQSTSLAIPDAHAFTQGAEIGIVALVSPNIQEGFAVGKFEVVIFRQTVSNELISLWKQEGKKGGKRTLEKPPKEQYTPESLPPLLP